MKTIMLYHSKQGHTEECMHHIMKNHPEAILKKVTSFTGDVSLYDIVVLGTPVYMGSINKKIKEFIEDNHSQLFKRKLYIVICAMNDAEYDQMLKKNFDSNLLEHATIIHPGGGYDLNRLNFFERFIVKKLTNVKASEKHLNFSKLNQIL